jgi:hypothetical protein
VNSRDDASGMRTLNMMRRSCISNTTAFRRWRTPRRRAPCRPEQRLQLEPRAVDGNVGVLREAPCHHGLPIRGWSLAMVVLLPHANLLPALPIGLHTLCKPDCAVVWNAAPDSE